MTIKQRASIEFVFEYFRGLNPTVVIRYLKHGQLPDSYLAQERRQDALIYADPADAQYLPKLPEPHVLAVFEDTSLAALTRKIESHVSKAQLIEAKIISFDMTVRDAEYQAPSITTMRLYVE